MKIVIIGGTGLIGSKVVRMLRDRGHDAVPAALETGVNTVTGAGLAVAISGATVVVDVSNSPSFDGRRRCSSSRPRPTTFSLRKRDRR
jgi:uncharacterized protein YbjT (DUF2867 family)